MAAELIKATPGSPSHWLRLPPLEGSGGALQEVRHGLESWALVAGEPVAGALTLESGAWPLHTGELRELIALLEPRGLRLVAVRGHCRTTLVSAAALGLESVWAGEPPLERLAGEAPLPNQSDALLVHHGTLRSGDHLQSEGSVLLLGDVNPGAQISAGGHVLVWGRLRGVAHAGRRGNGAARIVALQLMPLQLRIATTVARGPQDRPPQGLAEEARLEAGEIRIEPAPAIWPLAR
jgi:septum site-determining protein MinC